MLVCHDEAAGRAMSERLRDVRPVATRALGDRTPIGGQIPDVILAVGLPPDAPGGFRRLRASLEPLLDRNLPVLWLLDPAPDQDVPDRDTPDRDTPDRTAPDRSLPIRDQIQARALGADAILPAASPAALIRATADRLPEQAAASHAQRSTLRDDVLEDVGARLALPVAHSLRLLRDAMAPRAVDLWLNTVATIHEPTYRHSLLTGGITAALALALDIPPKHRERLVRAALLHDIGKTLVPAAILDKPGVLSPAEMAVIERHAQHGYEMLHAQGDHDPETLLIVRHHHERLDGSGYPSGLRGNRIDRELRIVMICDIFAALTEQRPYRPGYPAPRALEMMAAMHDKLDHGILARLRQLLDPR